MKEANTNSLTWCESYYHGLNKENKDERGIALYLRLVTFYYQL